MRKCFVFFFLVALLCSVSVSLFAQSAKPSAVPLLGDNSIEWQSDSNPSGQAEAFPVRAISSGSVASMAVFLDRVSTSQQLVVGLYADNNGHPGALLAQASTAQPNAGAWNTLPVTPTNVVQGTRYWIAVMGSGSGAIRFRDSNRGFCNSETSAQSGLTSLPPSWTTGGRWSTCRVSAFGSGASAPVTVSVAVLPSAASLKGGKSQQFNANVSGTSNTSVAWKASGGAVASNGMFTAPMSPGSYVVTATSMADSTKSASAAVTVTATTTVGVTISPGSASLTTGGTQQFTASVSGSSTTGVTWSASGGQISSSGLYTAPSSAGTFSVTATSVADPTQSASATVTVTAPQAVAVSVKPGSASLATGGTQQFTATVTGSSNTAVTWSANGGSISTSGLFTAPSTAGSLTVTATSAADSTKSASATVTVSAPVVSVTISPVSASMLTGGTQTFTAGVTGSSNTSVTWSATGGSISLGGTYTAPSTAGAFTVKATSAADTTKSASATVTVSAQTVAVSISPGTASLAPSATQPFTATVTGSTGSTAVTWTTSGGTISAGGLYTAPSSAGTFSVTATSVADPTKSAAANVSVTAPVQHSASLNWNPSASAVAGYNVYRGSVSGGPYTIMNTSLDGSTNFVDFNVQAGQTLFYVVTSVETNGMESSFSNEVKALIP